MYESFFRFTSRPFVAAPLVSNYFASESAEAARQTLTRSIDRAEGPGLIIGPAGVGKTLLCRMLADRFQETYQVAMLSSTRILTRKALLQNILFELGLAYRGMEEGELRLSLLDYLQPNEACPNGILLIVDEAHSLPLRLLEEVRMITNLVRDGQPRVRLVMAGGAKLEEKFASPKLDSFNQRIAARCYLEPFGRDDTIDYVLSRITAAGGNGQGHADAIFDEGALRAIYQATDGIPRLINQVCDHALVMAFAGGRQQIDAAGVEEAWADLQQLPGPWQDTTAAETTGTTIEFGELDAEPAVAEFGGESFEEASALLSLESEAAFGVTTEEPLTEGTAVDVETPSVAVEPQIAVCDPFGDGFDEEEVVIDQAVIKSAEIFANRTRVVSPEGRELAASMLPESENVTVSHSPSESDTCSEHPSSECVASAFEDELTSTIEDDLASTSEDEVASTIEDEVASTSEDEVGIEEPVSAPIADSVTVIEEQEVSQDDWVSQAAGGPQMFEYTAFEPNGAANLALEALCDVNIALGDLDYEAPEEPTVKMVDHPSVGEADGSGDVPVNDDRAIIMVENDEPNIPPTTPEGSVHRVEYQALFSQLRHG
jgi:type II secretory pathway predicted ATPase ExeA